VAMRRSLIGIAFALRHVSIFMTLFQELQAMNIPTGSRFQQMRTNTEELFVPVLVRHIRSEPWYVRFSAADKRR